MPLGSVSEAKYMWITRVVEVNKPPKHVLYYNCGLTATTFLTKKFIAVDLSVHRRLNKIVGFSWSYR